jgi:hypothetical protein
LVAFADDAGPVLNDSLVDDSLVEDTVADVQALSNSVDPATTAATRTRTRT